MVTPACLSRMDNRNIAITRKSKNLKKETCGIRRVWFLTQNQRLRVNVFYPISCWDSSHGLFSLLTSVMSVYQLWSVMHALHLGNRPHTDTVLDWGYSVSWLWVWCHCCLHFIISKDSYENIVEKNSTIASQKRQNHLKLTTLLWL